MSPTATRLVNRFRDFFQRRALLRSLQCCSGKAGLEIGCGTGRWLVRGARLGVKFIGIDLSAEMLNIAKRQKPLHSLDLLNAEAAHLPFREGAFDCVLSVTTLQHVIDRGDLVRTVSEFGRILAQGGRAILLESALTQESVEVVTTDYVTSLRSLKEWERVFGSQDFRLESAKPVNPLLENKLSGIVRKKFFRYNDIYNRQLNGKLSASQRILKLPWNAAITLLTVLLFPLDLLLAERLPHLSTHKVMIFQLENTGELGSTDSVFKKNNETST